MSVSLERRLQSVRNRVRWLVAGFGTGRILVAATGLLLAIVTLDYLLNLRAWPRVVLVGGAVLLLGGLVWQWLLRALTSRLTLSDVAGRVEEAFPQLEDRLRSAVAFSYPPPSSPPTSPPASTSPATTLARPGPSPAADTGVESPLLRERVRQQAEQMISGLDLRAAVNPAPTRQWLLRGLLGVLFVAVLATLVPGDYRRAAVGRLLTPFAGVSWPKGTEIAVLSPLPTKVASGDRIDVRMRLDRGDRPSARATVYFQYEGGPVRSEGMSRSPDGTYSVSLDARAATDTTGTAETNAALRVWVKAGDDEEPVGSMTVVPRLAVRRVAAEVVPPAYAASRQSPGPAGEVDLSQSPAVVVEGSELRLRLVFSKPLSGAPRLLIADPASTAPSDPASAADRTIATTTRQLDGAAAELAFAPEKTVRFRVAAVDEDGFTTTALTQYEVVVRPDQAPAIQIELPRRSEERTATAAVPLEGMSEDDFAVLAIHLNVKRLGDGREWRIPLVEAGTPAVGVAFEAAASSPDRTRMRVRHLWELASLPGADLKPGDVLEYHLSAIDNYRRETPAGVRVHPEATSSRLRITIVSQDDLAARVAEELRSAATQIEQLRQSQRRTAEETRELSQAVAGKPALDEAQQRQARRLAEQQSVVASQSKQVAAKLDDLLRRMAENRMENRELPTTAQDVRDTLSRASEGPMKSAAADLGDARQTPDPGRRDQKLNEADRQQDEADKLLSQALERLSSLGSLRQTIDNLRRMLAEQQDTTKQTADLARDNVGKRPEEMKPEDREKLRALAERQKSLSERTEKMLGDMDQQAQQLAKSDPESSEALKKSSETGRQEGVPGAQSKASSAMQQNQQNQARSEQRKAEIGLQVMLNQLKDAERRKLEALTKKLADLAEQLATLVRRQSGHNLDNLGLRVGALQAAGEKQLAALLERAERTADKPAVSDLPSLSGGQEQTERNTRALSESLSGVQGAAEAASAVARAASRMERAAVLLRRADVAAAYEPPQVEALAALLDAAAQVEALQRENEEQLKQEQRESVKAQYVAIRAEQDTLNKETARLGALASRGELPRADAVRLAQLPGVQGALAERTSKVEEDLIELSSVVFVWANKDIVQAMDGVKNLLGQGKTDAPVRIEQTRILEQLDAMIASLTVKPYDKEFEDRQGGEGGGGQGENQPRLPSEAELRLLKGLQEAVNRATKSQAAAAADAAAAGRGAVEAVGRRQGDLRGLLGEMVSKASRGRIKLPDEPTKPLAEEASTARDEDRALEDDLLQGKPDAAGSGENVVESAANRMARSRQRLVTDADPGPITQQLQDRILKDLDRLIEEARRQDQQSSSSSSSSKGGGQSKPQPQTGNEQANNQGDQQQGGESSGQGTEGARNSNNAGASARDPGKQGGDLRERLAEWGAISPRQRQAIIEGAGDTPIEKYRALIEDYYRSLAEKQSGGR